VRSLEDLVSEVVTAYHEWYRPERGCTCVSFPWFKIDGVLLPGVCSLHEFISKKVYLQQAITDAGLSLPIPTMVEGRAPPDYSVLDHPLFKNAQVPRLSGGTVYAAKLASFLSRTHVVFYLDRTKFINLSFGQRDDEIERVLMLAPVLVYLKNKDGRSNGRDEMLLLSRQYGFAYLVI
jgi:hypothetical protein